MMPSEYLSNLNKLPNEARDKIKDIKIILDDLREMRMEGVLTPDQRIAARNCVKYITQNF